MFTCKFHVKLVFFLGALGGHISPLLFSCNALCKAFWENNKLEYDGEIKRQPNLKVGRSIRVDQKSLYSIQLKMQSSQLKLNDRLKIRQKGNQQIR
jgi:hypothetical protein